MDATPTRRAAASTLDCYTNQGTVKVFSKTITVKTNERSELVNMTNEIQTFVEATGVEDGYVQVSSLHTTAGLFVNEWQEALLSDVKSMIEQLVPHETYYRHNDPQYSDCDRHNAHSHLRNIVVGLSVSVPIAQGKLVLGRWQSVILAEFDGPNERKVFMQVLGI
jgi:secondary thiamine-phosphate synthase enzyme